MRHDLVDPTDLRRRRETLLEELARLEASPDDERRRAILIELATLGPRRNLRVLEPCKQPWSAMSGGDEVRRCEVCERPVWDLTKRTRVQIDALLSDMPSAPCVRMRTGPGGVLAARPGAPLHRARQVAAQLGLTSLLLLLAEGCGSEPGPATSMPAPGPSMSPMSAETSEPQSEPPGAAEPVVGASIPDEAVGLIAFVTPTVELPDLAVTLEVPPEDAELASRLGPLETFLRDCYQRADGAAELPGGTLELRFAGPGRVQIIPSRGLEGVAGCVENLLEGELPSARGTARVRYRRGSGS